MAFRNLRCDSPSRRPRGQRLLLLLMLAIFAASLSIRDLGPEAAGDSVRTAGNGADGVNAVSQPFPPPAAWKTAWGYGLYTLTLSLGVVGYLRFRKEIGKERAISARLQEANRIKDKFLANTSHQLYKPVCDITGIAESLIDGATGQLSETTKSNLTMIVASGRRLSGLVGNIRDVSDLSQRKSLELRKQPVDLRTLTEVVLVLSQPLVGGKDLELINEIEPGLPLVDADENRLQQILYDLIDNCIQLTDSGSVRVRAVAEHGQLVVSVSDTGIGVARDQLEDLFDSWPGSVGEAAGSLGIAITRQLVEIHGGDLWIESRPGKGATFFFTLPISGAETPTPATRPRTFEPVAGQQSPEPGSPREPRSAGAARILVVDDDPVSRLVLVNHLATMGYHVTQATGGQEALRLLNERKFDLVLLDIMMPKISGYEVCRIIRQRFSVQELPVIFLTARSLVCDLVTGFAFGANDYLIKPTDRGELLARVKTHVDLVLTHRNLGSLVEDRTAQIRQLMAELEARNSELERFAYTVSHDLKSPLVTIQGFLDLLQSDAAAGDREDLEKDIHHIRSAAEKMQQLIEDLLDFSRIGRLFNPPQEVPFGELVSEAVELVAGQIAERRVKVEIAPDLPVVFGDRVRLLEVVLNLLNNAVKYMGDQTAPRVEVGARQEGADTVFFVRDNGIGIEARHHDEIFGLFKRLSNGEEGTGFGLSLARRIVEVHGGRIWVESEGRGRGSTFCFTLLDRPPSAPPGDPRRDPAPPSV